MISKPKAACPRCGGDLTVLNIINVSKYAETVTYYCECDCGAADLTVYRGEVTDITLRPPVDIPEYTNDPTDEELIYRESLA